MGNLFAPQKRDVKVLMLGPSGSGKTTLIYKLRHRREMPGILPTVGVNVEQVVYKGKILMMWDLSRQERARPLLRHYFNNVLALVCVVDSTDRDKISCAREELHSLMREDELRNAFVLIFANKQDLPNAIAADELKELLGLNDFQQRKWHVQASSALSDASDSGLDDGIDWLLAQL